MTHHWRPDLKRDKAHCASRAAHDYRPDYGKLGILRVVFLICEVSAIANDLCLEPIS